MNLEQFGFVKSARSAAISSAVDSEDQTEDVCKSDNPTAPPSKRRRFNSNWTEGCTWLKHNQDNSVMFCEWCRRFDRNEHRNQFVKGCSSMKLESVKKHEESRQHKDAKAAQRASARPHRTPMELTIQTMERSEVKQMKRLFNAGFYLVEAEHPFRKKIGCGDQKISLATEFED